jgi:uncharacterized Ntn-hydrolase superfamily protein
MGNANKRFNGTRPQTIKHFHVLLKDEKIAASQAKRPFPETGGLAEKVESMQEVAMCRNFRVGLVLAPFLFLALATARQAGVPSVNPEFWDPVATFSILGYDPATGEIGGAVQSRVFCVGNGVLWAEAGIGAAATQAIVDVSYGPQALELLKQGLVPDAIIKQIWESDPDPQPERWSKQGRQFAVMNAKGEYAAFTGEKATPWAGHRGGKYCTAQGNILAGEEVVTGMVKAFEDTTGHLSLRLLAALEAGQKAGGDTRGMQSAAMLIVKKDGGVWLHNDVVLRLQVDDNPEPIQELRRLVERAVRTFRLGGRQGK